MAISRLGSGTGTTSATLPTHAAGDLIIVGAYRDGNATAPSIPGDYTSIQSAGASSNSIRVGYKVAASSSEVTGTWTNATSLIVVVYRGVHPVCPIGGSAITSGSSTSISYPTIVDFRNNADTSSWAVGFAGHRSTNVAIETAPSGMTNVTSVSDATDEAGLHDTNTGVNSWTATSASVGGTSAAWYSVTVEVIAAEPTGSAGTPTNTGFFSPTASISGTWTGHANTFASDNVYATTTVSPSGENSIWAGNFAGLLAAIPLGASIDGIEVTVEGSAATDAGGYCYMHLASAAGSFLPFRSATSQACALVASESTVTVGGSSNLWGGYDTNNDNTSNRAWQRVDFGAYFYAMLGLGAGSGGSRAGSIDHFQLKVHYTPLAVASTFRGLMMTGMGT